jgi:L-rhamnose isomerase / sugar isomerase
VRTLDGGDDTTARPAKSMAAFENIRIESGFVIRLRMRQTRRMIDEDVLDRLAALRIETPSWGYGNSGTRFHVYPWPGAARTVYERLDDAALVHRLTGCCPSVALHIPWDRVDDWPALRDYAAARGIAIGAINPNLFGDDEYRLGSICNPDGRVRARALEHCRECVEIAAEVGSTLISLWLADGTNYPGQDDLRGRHERLAAGLEEIYAELRPGMRLLVEYKFFEPGFYSTDLPDWGTAALLCRRLGPQAQVLVDTGHHPQGTNIEQIVAVLLGEGILGGFHFNNRKYADDDLIVGSIDPFELFRIMHELAIAPGSENVALMIDQSHNVEGKVDAMIQSVMNIQTAYAKALVVDEERLGEAQLEGDVLGAHRVLLEAFETDVRPLVAHLRERLGVEADPVAAFREGGYGERLAQERGVASVESAYEQL